MNLKQVLEQLYQLVSDRQSFITGDEEHDEIYKKDREALLIACNIINNLISLQDQCIDVMKHN